LPVLRRTARRSLKQLWSQVIQTTPTIVLIGFQVLIQSAVTAQTPPPSELAAVAWSPNGEMIAGVGSNGLVRIWDADTGQVLHDLQGGARFVNSVAWSPDNTRIASGGDDPTIRVWSAVTGQLLASLEGHGTTVVTIAWNADGSQLASASFGDGLDDSLRIWNGITYQPIAQQQQGSINAIAWNPNQNEVAVANQNGYLSVKPITPTVILPSRFAVLGSAPMFSLAWNSDGSKLASGDDAGRIDIWDAATGTPIAAFLGHTDLVGALAWSPDDTRLASASVDDSIQVWDAATGQTLAVIPNEKAKIPTLIAWSPDGTRLVYGGANDEPQIVLVPSSCTITISAGDTVNLTGAINTANGNDMPDTIFINQSTYTLTAPDNATELVAVLLRFYWRLAAGYWSLAAATSTSTRWPLTK
jgi:WD40 repeat protein